MSPRGAIPGSDVATRKRLRRSLALGLAAAMLSAAGAEGATINFDNLNAPGTDSGTGLVVNVQYNGQGVTFNDPSAFDYSKPTPIPGFTHSGTVAVEPCAGVEFCTSPVRATFTAAQRSVRAWVGFSSPLAEPLGVRLTGFDASSNVIATDNATLPANPGGPTPIQTPLEIDAPPARIVRADVSVTTGGGFSNGLAVDDIEFSTVGPPPPCTATDPPFVTLSQPQNFSTVHNNEFRLQGTVNHGGAPITSASVIATSEAGATRTASVYPRLINSEGGSFGPVRFNGMLFDPLPGFNEIVVTATNCRGTGTSDPRRVFWSPLPATTRFKQLGMIEVTQSVQTTLNSVPLIARAANGVKRTFARVYLQVQGGPDIVERVTASLTAVRPDGSRPPGPLRVFSINPAPGYAFLGSGSLAEMRSANLVDPLIFELPPEWLDAGRLHLELENIYIEGSQTTFPCDDCANLGPAGPPLGRVGPATVRFHEAPPVRLWLVSMPYRLSPGASPLTPSQTEIDGMASIIRRMYPTAEVQVTQATMPVADDPPETCKEAQSRLGEFVATVAGQHPRTRYLGLLDDDPSVVVEDDDGNNIGGCAQRPGRHGWIFADDETGGAHELGHMYGRVHVAGCTLFEGSSVDAGFPHPGGLIGSELFGDALGLDAGDMALGLRMQLLDWRDGFADVMSYCDDLWLSDYNYGNLLGRLCDEDPANCPSASVISPRRATAARPQGGGPRLRVAGTLPAPGRAKLGSLAVLPGLKLTPRPRRSPYAIVLRARGGRVLARHPIKAIEVGEDSTRSIDAVVPFESDAERIAIVKGKRTLDSAPVSAHPPAVRVTSPKRKRLRKRTTVRWRARDADGGRLTYVLLYGPERGRWIPVASDLRKRSFSVDPSELPGAKRARFRVLANDGVLTGAGESRRLRVKAKRPQVSITSPATGAEVTADQPVQLVATVLDLQDVPFKSRRVVWHSSLQGKLGRGAAISASLVPGAHEITATAKNSARRKSTAAVGLSVSALPPLMSADAVGP